MMFDIPIYVYVIFAITAIIIYIIYLKVALKLHVDVRSFFQPTHPLDRGLFGVYCFTGHQGSGKTYALVKYIKRYCPDKQIYSNIHLIGIDYTPINSLDHLLSLADKTGVVIVYDEIFSLMSKSKKNAAMLEQFLPQMRKVKNIFLTTAQYWLELDMTFRRFVRIQIECETKPLGKLGGILREYYYDAEKMKWSNLDNEYIAPIISSKISKYEASVMNSYDTYERVKALSGQLKNT